MLHLGFLVVVGQLIEDFVACLGLEISVIVEAFASDASSEVEILLHYGDSGGVDGT